MTRPDTKTASQRGRAARAKGAAYERAVATTIRPWFPDVRRSRDNGSTTTSDTGDLLDAGPIWWSCKDDAKGDLGTPGIIDAWQREAVHKAGPHLMPLIVQKRRGHADPLRAWCWIRVADLVHCWRAMDEEPGGNREVWARLELGHILGILAAANYALDPARLTRDSA